MASIKVLPLQLANQIAAGEVVERPAAVVKELLENAIDAGADKISIDIELGGIKLIRVRDNGCGIAKNELILALMRHATSKIASVSDLESITSLGFRGEALASISSVSRLILTSKTSLQDEAWQVYAEGETAAAVLKPAAHPTGSTVEVRDLFYNIPARRKFLRTEKTEFSHIEEIVKRVALVYFHVELTLLHNGKRIRFYRAVKDLSQPLKRLEVILGNHFTQKVSAICWDCHGLSLQGWVLIENTENKPTDIQYFYVNKRIIKDRLINHAIRQAYHTLFKEISEIHPSYILYLELDPKQIDVNVHPTKYEIRFHQARLVHDFIYQAILSVCQQQLTTVLKESTDYQLENRAAAGENVFKNALDSSIPQLIKQDGVKSHKTGSIVHFGEYTQKIYADFSAPPPINEPVSPANFVQASFINNSQQLNLSPVKEEMLNATQQKNFGKILSIINVSFAVLQRDEQLFIISLMNAERYLRIKQLTPTNKRVAIQPLLVPVKLPLDIVPMSIIKKHLPLLEILGIQITLAGLHIIIKAIPPVLRTQNIQELVAVLLVFLQDEDGKVVLDSIIKCLASYLVKHKQFWTLSDAIQIVSELERLCPELVDEQPQTVIQRIVLVNVFNALEM